MIVTCVCVVLHLCFICIYFLMIFERALFASSYSIFSFFTDYVCFSILWN